MSTQTYYVPHQSRWPILASIALFLMAMGAGGYINGLGQQDSGGSGGFMLLAGSLLLSVILIGWFRNVIHESRAGMNSEQLDASYRWGMTWFIFSEVMFFAAFFGVLFYVRMFAVPWLGGEGDKGVSNMLWQGFEAQWPLMTTPDMKAFPGPEAIVDPWHIPLLNTVLLLASSVTVTFAHYALKRSQRDAVVIWLAATILLGVTFIYYQAIEYVEAYQQLGLTLQAGIYGATFFVLTGFHGLHVTLGTFMLIVIWLRVMKGHFTPQNHFAFEAVSWYWHFVDVVWVGLFLFVYIL